jgi:hypothetical protein
MAACRTARAGGARGGARAARGPKLLLNQLCSVPGPPAQVEEFYVITWTAKKEQIFEMPVRAGAERSACARVAPGAES